MTAIPADQNEGPPEPAFPAGDLAHLADPGSDKELPDAATVAAENADGAWIAPRRSRAGAAASAAASLTLHLAILAFLVGAPGAIWRIAGAEDTGKALSGDSAINVAIVAPPKPQPAPKPPPPPSPPAKAAPQPEAETPKRRILAVPAAKERADAVPAEQGPPDRAPIRETEVEQPLQERAEATDTPNPPSREQSTETAVPIPTPRPDHVPQTEQMATRRMPAEGRSHQERRRGTIGGDTDGTAASTEAGRADAATGDAAATDYPGTIARKLNDALRYPAEAAKRKVKGQARVQFVLDTAGKVVSVEVIDSSGSEILDRAAIETVRRAAPFPPIPPEAGREEWPFKVTLAFGK